ncbi:TPA: hypothetical protein QDC06_000207 [Burkholderia cepacia]|nr:hypothetical protein BZY94_06050 [Burkholderia territorii]HDR9497022.1 hypothetical protein [Burkholderia cepacia]
MIRLALAIPVFGLLSACAGQATYDIRPFYDKASEQVLCCAATIANSKDIASVTVHVQKSADGYTLDFSEVGVGATAPMTAQNAAISSVAAAASNVAISASKFSLKP